MGTRKTSTSQLDSNFSPTMNSSNPNPNNYTITDSIQIGNLLILMINYKDCTNFEGDKILVYHATLDQLKKQKLIDPHFSQSKEYIHPIARFVPTDKGLKMAIKFCKSYN